MAKSPSPSGTILPIRQPVTDHGDHNNARSFVSPGGAVVQHVLLTSGRVPQTLVGVIVPDRTADTTATVEEQAVVGTSDVHVAEAAMLIEAVLPFGTVDDATGTSRAFWLGGSSDDTPLPNLSCNVNSHSFPVLPQQQQESAESFVWSGLIYLPQIKFN